MNSPIRNNHGHHAADLAQQAQAGGEHMGQLTQARGFTGVKVQHTKLQRARMQHNKMLAAAFYRGKRFAEGMHKPPPPSAQKLMRQLGQRPRPAPSAKAQGKEASARERPDGQHALEPRHEHEHPHEHEREREHEHEHEHEQGRQQKRERDQQHGDGQQQHRNGHGHDRGSNPQGEEQGQGQGQPQQNAPRDGQPRRDGRQSGEGRDKPRKFAIGKAGRAKAAARGQPLAATMQLLARQKLGAPDLPAELAAACAKEVLRLAAQIELGPLLAVPMLLAMRSPMALRRNAARLHAHRHAALMQSAATPGKAAAVAGLLGVSLDNTLARQSAGVEYSYDDQSIAAVKQRILDTQAALPAGGAQAGAAVAGGAIGGQTGAARQGAAKPTAGASDKTFEVRMAPAAPTAKP
ncbi:helicase [Burkholderia ambifaria]|uniref:helicase n=1 Tax=Burkholderia ambifaria TaxID=152480 RepID=UPI00158CB783|nr:helicase [Burkholderia ambifaria]WDR97694.1 helicase [Burkholderia ambifaria]